MRTKLDHQHITETELLSGPEKMNKGQIGELFQKLKDCSECFRIWNKTFGHPVKED